MGRLTKEQQAARDAEKAGQATTVQPSALPTSQATQGTGETSGIANNENAEKEALQTKIANTDDQQLGPTGTNGQPGPLGVQVDAEQRQSVIGETDISIDGTVFPIDEKQLLVDRGVIDHDGLVLMSKEQFEAFKPELFITQEEVDANPVITAAGFKVGDLKGNKTFNEIQLFLKNNPWFLHPTDPEYKPNPADEQQPDEKQMVWTLQELRDLNDQIAGHESAYKSLLESAEELNIDTNSLQSAFSGFRQQLISLQDSKEVDVKPYFETYKEVADSVEAEIDRLNQGGENFNKSNQLTGANVGQSEKGYVYHGDHLTESQLHESNITFDWSEVTAPEHLRFKPKDN